MRKKPSPMGGRKIRTGPVTGGSPGKRKRPKAAKIKKLRA